MVFSLEHPISLQGVLLHFVSKASGWMLGKKKPWHVRQGRMSL